MTHCAPQKVWRRVTRTGTCPRCGRRVRRTRTFWQTVSPLNLNGVGEPKTPHEIHEDLERESDHWVPDFTHDFACANADGAA